MELTVLFSSYSLYILLEDGTEYVFHNVVDEYENNQGLGIKQSNGKETWIRIDENKIIKVVRE